MTLCIISHTKHYEDQNGEIKGWESTVNEINHLLEIADKIIHVAPLHEESPSSSSFAYINPKKIKFIPLKPSGGKGLKKISIAWNALFNLKQIRKGIQQADILQFRAPTGIGLYVLPFLKWLNTKPYWVKYAGNWIDPHMPLGNRLQKQWLLNCLDNQTQVTYNGSWVAKSQFLSLHNPCFTFQEYEQAKSVSKFKTNPHEEGWTIRFVGSLNKHKGIPIILETLKQLPDEIHIKTIHLIGDGHDRKLYEKIAEQVDIDILFHGFLPKLEVYQMLSESHALLLPSKSEGFPKVVGEAMAFGCVPIVSKVSCIEDYIIDGENGFLIKELTPFALIRCIQDLIKLDLADLQRLRLKNYNFAKNFTYQQYNQVLKEKIINVRL